MSNNMNNADPINTNPNTNHHIAMDAGYWVVWTRNTSGGWNRIAICQTREGALQVLTLAC